MVRVLGTTADPAGVKLSRSILQPEHPTRPMRSSLFSCWHTRPSRATLHPPPPPVFLAFDDALQMWVWGVSLPVLFVNSDQVNPDFGTVDIIGAVLAAAGWIIETVADLQKNAFR